MIVDPENPVVFDKVEGGIEFDQVSFGYNKDIPVLKGVSFQVSPGEQVALVGPSGAGKSTVVQLVHRFFDVDSGAIRVDGHDIRETELKTFLNHVALVPQETLLFGGTIRENILYGKLNATSEELDRAARFANAYDFISNLDQGYDTVVGEKGVKLSGGERQRIAIARALLKNPKILILDEATSSLDNQSEMLIQDALENLMQGRTTLIIAHRLSTVHNADRIIVLDKGRVVEAGNHKELMTHEGLYNKLYTLRAFEDPVPVENEG